MGFLFFLSSGLQSLLLKNKTVAKTDVAYSLHVHFNVF